MDKEQPVLQASILDRLIDLDPKNSRESVQFRWQNIRDIKAAVVRDLEYLLNSRRTILPPPPSFHALNNSLYTYGIKDFTSENPKSNLVQKSLRQDVEKAIARFEPRLKNVIVAFDGGSKTGRDLVFRIQALLVINPISEPVSFDTYFDINRSEYVIS